MGLDCLVSINGETQDRMPPSGLAPLWLSLVDGLVPLIRWDLHDPTTQLCHQLQGQQGPLGSTLQWLQNP